VKHLAVEAVNHIKKQLEGHAAVVVLIGAPSEGDRNLCIEVSGDPLELAALLDLAKSMVHHQMLTGEQKL
jgi:hypothetical protein